MGMERLARLKKYGGIQMKKALITGITGQDGSYLAEYLVELGYEVYGIVRRQSVAENQSSRIHQINDKVTRYYGDLTDEHSLYKIIKKVEPDEIYNLAAMSHVRVSFDDGCQRLTTIMSPVSPYGCSKVMGYNLVRHYRNAYKLHACNGILFNHESPRRGTNFVTHKVVKGAVEIKKGLRDKLELGNMDSSRDWGHSYDYVRAMHLLLNHSEARDWIVATGETRTVRQLCDYVFTSLGMDYRDYVVQDERYMRPEELKYLRGDSEDICNKLGWKPKYNFETMIDEMIQVWEERL